MGMTIQCYLNVDLPQLRAQQELLLRLRESLASGTPFEAVASDSHRLDGLIQLTRQIAEQACDPVDVACLTESGACDCEAPGYFCSGVPGILAYVEGGKLAPDAQVERCDGCRRYPSDEAARIRLVELGIAPRRPASS